MTRDEHFMAIAVRLAKQARGRTRPNPLVGAVVVQAGTDPLRDKIVGRGYHKMAGTPHAEVHALAEAGHLAKGGELFVNLEPCSHHGQTPPCIDAVIRSGVRRVVIGMIDPNPKVNGSGVDALKRAQIEVSVGVLAQRCQAINLPFTTFMTKQRPWVALKSAMTLDGCVATSSGQSRWITGDTARRRVHRLRNAYDAVVVGVGTVLNDDPSLTCRDISDGRDPIRIVFDSQLRTPLTARVVQLATSSAAPTWILTTKLRATSSVATALRDAGVLVFGVESENNERVDVRAALRCLYEQKVTSVLLESGPQLAGAFWRAQTVDRLMFAIAPKVLGDSAGLPPIAAAPAVSLSQAVGVVDVRYRRMGQDVWMEGRPDFLNKV